MSDEFSAGSAAPDAQFILELAHELRTQWADRNSDYLKARNAYRGDHWEGLGLPRPHNRYSLTANYLAPFADKDVQLIMGEVPAIMVPPPTADDEGRRFAERLEGLLYGSWTLNDSARVFLNAAWHASVLRRGILYYWWDPGAGHVRFKSCVPENFYPVYDGDDIHEAIHVQRRLTRSLRAAYPQYSEDIVPDDGGFSYAQQALPVSQVVGGITDALSLDVDVVGALRAETPSSYTTVLDYYNRDGWWVRIMGRAVHSQNLDYGVSEVPFIDIPNSVSGDEREPRSSIEELVELNQYYNQLLSQKADIIRKYSNPPILDYGSGQDPAKMQQIISGDGGVIPARSGSNIEMLAFPPGPDIEGQMVEVRDVMFDLSGKPRSSFGQTVTNQSGVVTNLTLTPTLQSNEVRQSIWSGALERLNERILMLYERFSKGQEIHFRGLRTVVRGASRKVSPFEVTITGGEISGWYSNRIKWPSVIRVDDPVYVDTQLKMLQAQPQAMSLFDFMENVGVERVESAIDRIRAEREDPRIHPEVLSETVSSLSGLSGMAGVGPSLMGLGASGAEPDVMSEDETAVATGQPLQARGA